MKILLFGKGGQVGWELQRSLGVLGEVVALGTASTDLCGDFTNPQGVVDAVRQVRPDVIVNAAAHTAVDKAETEHALAQAINATAPGVLAREAARLGALLVHYSTDYVFDGQGDTPWLETDPTAPLNVYGASKLEGERLVVASGCRHLIFRTSWVYGARGGNFAKTMLRLARERSSLNVIDDQVGAPTGADLLADVTAHAIRSMESRVTNPPAPASGIYHLSAAGQTSWHGYARFVLLSAQQAGVELKVAPDAVLAIPSASYPTPAKRPLNSRLNTHKLQAAFGLHLPPWQQGVARMLTEHFQEILP